MCFRLALLHSMSYFFFLYRSSSSPSCSVLDVVSTNIDRALSKHPTVNVFVFGDFNVHHVEWLKHSRGTDQPGEYSFNFYITHDLTQSVDFSTRIPVCDTHRPALLDLFLTSDPGLSAVGVFAPHRNSDHVVVSVSVDFGVTSEKDAPYHCKAFDYSRGDWDGFRDLLRDVHWNNIYKYDASRAACEFSEWLQVGIDTYTPNGKYQVKPHLSLLFSPSCAAAIAHRNNFFHLYQRDKSAGSRALFRQASNCCKRVIESAKKRYVEMKKEFIFSHKVGSYDFWRIANSVLNRGKFTISPLFNDPEVLTSASEKAKLFAELFSKNSNIADSGHDLPSFSRRTDITLSNMVITPKIVKKAISNLDLSKVSGPEGIPVVLLLNSPSF